MGEIPPEVRAELAKLSDSEWSVLAAQVRAPDAAEQLRDVIGRVLTPQQTDLLVQVADVSKFIGTDGVIDETKVMAALTGMFAHIERPAPASGQVGADGRADAQRRHNISNPERGRQARDFGSDLPGGDARPEAEKALDRRHPGRNNK